MIANRTFYKNVSIISLSYAYRHWLGFRERAVRLELIISKSQHNYSTNMDNCSCMKF